MWTPSPFPWDCGYVIGVCRPPGPWRRPRLCLFVWFSLPGLHRSLLRISLLYPWPFGFSGSVSCLGVHTCAPRSLRPRTHRPLPLRAAYDHFCLDLGLWARPRGAPSPLSFLFTPLSSSSEGYSFKVTLSLQCFSSRATWHNPLSGFPRQEVPK